MLLLQSALPCSSREKELFVSGHRFTRAENTSINRLCEVNWRRCGRDRDYDQHHCKALSAECGRWPYKIHVTGAMKCCEHNKTHMIS